MRAYIIDRERVFARIESLVYIDKNKVLKKALGKAASVLVKEGRVALKSKHKKKTGNLYRSISYIQKRRKIGALAGFSRKRGGNHAHLLDKGTKERYTRAGRYTGKLNASNFWSDSVDRKEDEVINTLYQGVEDAIYKLMQR